MVKLPNVDFLPEHHIFSTEQPLFVIAILCFMLAAAGFIALRPMRQQDKYIYAKALLAISTGGLFTLIVVVGLVLRLSPSSIHVT